MHIWTRMFAIYTDNIVTNKLEHVSTVTYQYIYIDMVIHHTNLSVVNIHVLIYSNNFTPQEEKAYSWVHID